MVKWHNHRSLFFTSLACESNVIAVLVHDGKKKVSFLCSLLLQFPGTVMKVKH